MFSVSSCASLHLQLYSVYGKFKAPLHSNDKKYRWGEKRGKKAQSLIPTGPCFLVESYYIRYNPFLCKRFWDTENRDYFFSRNEKSQLLITQSKLDDAYRETDISKHGQKNPKQPDMTKCKLENTLYTWYLPTYLCVVLMCGWFSWFGPPTSNEGEY